MLLAAEAHSVPDPAKKMLRDFFLGFVKIHVLHHVSHEPWYGVQIIEELAHHGYDLSPGTLYPLLHNLEEAGYVQREDRVVDGKVRKYYQITPLGDEALKEARTKIRELVDEVLEPDGERSAGPNVGRTRASARR